MTELSRSWIDETILCYLEAGLMKEFSAEKTCYNDETNPKNLPNQQTLTFDETCSLFKYKLD